MKINGKLVTSLCVGLCLAFFLISGSCGGSGQKLLSSSPPTSQLAQNHQNQVDEDLPIGVAILRLKPLPGMDEELFTQLKENLLTGLVRRGIPLDAPLSDRRVSKPPSGPQSKVNDLIVNVDAPGQWSLQWSYRNQGDGNESNKVDLLDIFPLADAFFKSSSAADWARWEVADYNGSGKVDISEVFALADNFFGAVAGYLIQMQEEGSDTWTDIGSVAFADRTVNEQARDTFLTSVQVDPPPTVPVFVRVVPFDFNNVLGEGAASDGFRIEPSGVPPTINSISPTSGNPGSTVNFTADVTGNPPYNFNWTFGAPGEGFNPETYSGSGDTVEAPGITVPSTSGNYTITLYVEEQSSGLSTEQDFTFTVATLVPPQITDIQPRSATEGDDVLFTPTITGGTAPFTYQWTFPAGWTVDDPTIEKPTVTVGSQGIFDVSLQVTDSFALSDSMTIQFTVNPGEAPVINSINPDPFYVTIGAPNTISADVSGSTPISYDWQFGDAVTPSSSTNPQPSVTGLQERPEPDGTTGTLSVNNRFGSDGPRSFTMFVGFKPTVLSVAPAEGLVGTDVTFFIALTGTSPMQITWDFTDTGPPNETWANPATGSGASVVVNLIGSPGDHTGQVAVVNGYGSDIYTFNFRITTPGTPPTINSINPTGSGPGKTIDFTADVSGSTPFNYTWTFGNPGDGFNPETFAGSGDTVSAPAIKVPSTPGDYNINLYVENSAGSDVRDFTFTVGYDEQENNDNSGQANPVTLPMTGFLANLGPGGYDGDNNDWFRFQATAGQLLIAKATFDPSATIAFAVKSVGGAVKAQSYEISPGVQFADWLVDADGYYYFHFAIASPATNYDYRVDAEFKAYSPWPSGRIDDETSPDDNGDTGTFLEVVQGNPAVAYFGNTTGVFFARNDQADGSGNWAVNPVFTNLIGDPISDFGMNNSNLVIASGNPGLVYFHMRTDTTGGPPVKVYGRIRFARNENADGSGNWTQYDVTPLTQDYQATGFSLAIANGNPAVAYIEITDSYKVKYARAANQDGSGSWTVNTVDGTNSFELVNLDIVNGKPAVAYLTQDKKTIWYSINSSADGLGTWSSPVQIDSTTEADVVFNYPSLEVIDGKPAVSYVRVSSTGGFIYFARSSNADGTGAWSKTKLPLKGFSSSTSLSTIGGYPAIAAYRDAIGTYDLLYFVNSAVDASGTWDYDWVDITDDVGKNCSLKEVSGQPGVAYMYSGSVGSYPKFARRSG